MSERVSFQKDLFDDYSEITKQDIFEKLDQWVKEYRRLKRRDCEWDSAEEWLSIRLEVLHLELKQILEREEIHDLLDNAEEGEMQ